MANRTPGWRVVRLYEVADQRTEKIIPTGEDTRRYVALEHLAQGQPTVLGCSHARTASSVKTVFRTGDVLFGKLRPNLRKAAAAPFDGLCSTDILPLFGRDGLDTSYLLQLAQWHPLQRHAVATSSGTKMPRTSWKQLGEFTFLLPPLPEQRKIAAILSSVDDAIEKTQAVIDQVQVVKRGLMQELLTRGLPGRHTRFKQTEIGRIPEEWGTIRLGDVATVKGGKRMPKGRPFAPSVTPYPYIRVCDFKDGSVDTSSLEYVLPEDREQICRYTISKKDIYISIAGTLGIVGTVPPELDGAQLTENAARIIINDKRYMNKDFVKIAMEAECCQAQFGRLKGIGGGVPKLALFRIEQVRLPLPNQQEQQEIVDVLESIGAYHSTLRARLDAGHRLKLALMSVLLTGELRVTPDAEVA